MSWMIPDHFYIIEDRWIDRWINEVRGGGTTANVTSSNSTSSAYSYNAGYYPNYGVNIDPGYLNVTANPVGNQRSKETEDLINEVDNLLKT